MRKYMQRLLLELLPTLWEGVQYAKEKSREPELIKTVLSECFGGVTSIGELLQNEVSHDRYKEYSDIIGKLKGLLEELYELLLNKADGLAFTNSIQEQLQILEEKLKTDTELKLEVVFMPYTASMWDSLESIYLAAKDDPRCDAYVVPIPYHKRNTDFTLGDLHYEGDKLPPYIPVIHYEDYDLALRCPDAIYIHNPYDDMNYVTSVAPSYYSDMLKQYTDMLVYVPYYLNAVGFPQEHLYLPVYHNVNKIIVQNELGRQQLAPIYGEEKICVFGSPKADKAIACSQQKKIPPEWREGIGNKKVLMYSTGIGNLLRYNYYALKKMVYLLETFSKRSDAVVLWRPHPLLESSLSSMRPQLYKYYKAIMLEFVTKKMGILDMTPDINESAAICDGYVGEKGSSVIRLFGVMGKPIYITDTTIIRDPNEEEKRYIHFSELYSEGDLIWFVSDEHCALGRMNLLTGSMEEIIPIPHMAGQPSQYTDVKRYGNKLFLLPFNAMNICIYDMNTKLFDKIPFSDASPAANFTCMVSYQNYLFLIPFAYESIVRLNCETGELKYYSECMLPFLKYKTKKYSHIFAKAVDVQESRLLIASAYTNMCLAFDMETEEYEIHTVGTMKHGFFSMAFDGKDYWLVPFRTENEAYIVRWNLETGNTTEYNLFPSGFEILPNPNILPKESADISPFVSIVYCGSYLLVFPMTANMILRIDIETGEISELNTALPYKESDWNERFYSNCPSYMDISIFLNDTNYYFAKNINNDRVLALSSNRDHLLVIDTKTEDVRIIPCRLTEQQSMSVKRDISISDYGYREYCCYEMHTDRTLNDFLDYVTEDIIHDNTEQTAFYSTLIENLDGTCGEKVHQYISECI